MHRNAVFGQKQYELHKRFILKACDLFNIKDGDMNWLIDGFMNLLSLYLDAETHKSKKSSNYRS